MSVARLSGPFCRGRFVEAVLSLAVLSGYRTRFMNKISEFLAISASIIQGTGIGPVSYVVNASDLKAIFLLNKLFKCADDTYLIVPASQSHAIQNELKAIESWSQDNNLALNTKQNPQKLSFAGPNHGMPTCHRHLFHEYNGWARWWYWV